MACIICTLLVRIVNWLGTSRFPAGYWYQLSFYFKVPSFQLAGTLPIRNPHVVGLLLVADMQRSWLMSNTDLCISMVDELGYWLIQHDAGCLV